MADMYVPSFEDDEELEKNLTANMSKNDDLAEYVPSNLQALMARFGVAEEDESIRNEGFKLAEKGGLIKKPRPNDTTSYYMSGHIDSRDDISTEADSELSRVFDSAKSQHDSDNVYFGDLDISKTETAAAEEPKPQEAETEKNETAAEPPKKKRGRPRKNPLPEEIPVQEEKISEPEPQKNVEAETTEVVKKYNTHTKVIFVDDSLDDGIKRNSDDELEAVFKEESGRRKLWSRKRK